MGDPFMSGGAIAGAGINFASQQFTNAQQMALADKQMSFQERMSSTAYQRSAADMRAAGLNPMMMFGHGEAASSPGGAQAQLQAPKVPENLFQSIAATAAEVRVKDKQLDVMGQDIAESRARENVQKGELPVQRAQIAELAARTDLTNEEKMDIIIRHPESMNAALTAMHQMDLSPEMRSKLDKISFVGKSTREVAEDVIGLANAIGLGVFFRGLGRGAAYVPKAQAPVGPSAQRLEDIPKGDNYVPRTSSAAAERRLRDRIENLPNVARRGGRPLEGAPADPGMRPGGLREKAMGTVRRR